MLGISTTSSKPQIAVTPKPTSGTPSSKRVALPTDASWEPRLGHANTAKIFSHTEIYVGLTQNCPSKALSRRQYFSTARRRNAVGAVLRKSYYDSVRILDHLERNNVVPVDIQILKAGTEKEYRQLHIVFSSKEAAIACEELLRTIKVGGTYGSEKSLVELGNQKFAVTMRPDDLQTATAYLDRIEYFQVRHISAPIQN